MKKNLGLFLLCLLFSITSAFAEQSTVVITALNGVTSSLLVPKNNRINVKLIPNSNTDLTIDLENKYEEESDWAHVQSWTLTGASKAQVNTTDHPEQENVWYRLRCSSWTAGNCTSRIGQ